MLAHRFETGPKFAGTRTRLLVAFSLLVLIGSTVIVGYGNYVGGAGAH